MKKILFRADAKPSIGTGDLMSLIYLSKYFENDGWEAHFIIRGYNTGLLLAERYNLKNLLVIDSNCTVDGEVGRINNYIKEYGIDVVFFEITERKLTEYTGLNSNVLKAAACFDGAIPDDMDLIVDWDAEADKFFSPSEHPGTEFLLGPEYVILPVEFDYEKVKDRKYREKPERLLIAMGGADGLNFTQKIANVLIKNNIDMQLNIIIGAGYEYRSKLESSLKRSSARYVIKQNVANMYNEYLRCDVAIGAGGLIASELVATRTPSLLLATYEHQVARCRCFDSKGYVKYLGFRDFEEEELIKNITAPMPAANENIFKTKVIKEKIYELIERRKNRS